MVKPPFPRFDFCDQGSKVSPIPPTSLTRACRPHRNILVRTEDNTAKLADVLLAEALGGSVLNRKIHEHKRHAEAAYIAPEQLAKADYHADFRGDLYALGVLCYEMTTG